ncbi:hypothetical protein V8F20_003129 [Naviculisporaceae sp. PSN 640]
MSADDLSALFNRTLNLEPVRSVGQVAVPNEEPKIIYISTHYIQPTRPSNLAPPPAAAPPPVPQVDYSEVLEHLRYHGVETSGLVSPQLELFKNVDDSQRAVLMEYWKAAPPRKEQTQDMITTTVEQERTLANLRYDQMLEEEAMAQLQDMSQDSGSTPLTPVQSSNGSWIQTSPVNYMEPYMMDGYEDMARREFEESARNALMAEAQAGVKGTTAVPTQALDDTRSHPTYNPRHSDPVYNNTNNQAQQQQEEEMANQYGRLYWATGQISS